MKEILIVIGLVAVAVALLAIRIILKKNGQFSSHDIGASEAMRKRGIHCIRTQDWLERQPKKYKEDMEYIKKQKIQYIIQTMPLHYSFYL